MRSLIFCVTVFALCGGFLLANPPKGNAACTTTYIVIDGVTRQCQQCSGGTVICM